MLFYEHFLHAPLCYSVYVQFAMVDLQMLVYSLYPYLHCVHCLPGVMQLRTPVQVSLVNCIPNPHYMHLFDVP